MASPLGNYLDNLRKVKTPYKRGLTMAKNFVKENGGEFFKCEEKQTILELGHETVTCFQPYEDIDIFYYEN